MKFIRYIIERIGASMMYKWMLLLSAVTLSPILILGLASYSISKEAIEKKAMDSSRQLIRQTADNIDIRFASYKDMIMQLITSPEIMSLLQRLNTDKEGVIDSLSLTSKLAYYTAVSPDFKSVSFLSEQTYIKGIFRWDDQNDYRNQIYEQTIAARNEFVWLPTRVGYYSDTADSHQELVFSVSKQMFNIFDGSQLGLVAVLDIREEILRDILRKNTNAEVYTESFLVDEHGIILSHSDPSMILTSIDQWFEHDQLNENNMESSSILIYKNKQVLVNEYKLQAAPWKVIHIVDRASLFKESNRVIQLIVIIMLAGVLFSIITAYVLAKSVSTPLKRMVRAMNQVNIGNLSTRIDRSGHRKDEIASLQHHFNNMVEKIEQLIAMVYEEQNNKRIAEIKALEAQINPHFLYNTLDAIKWTALFQKANNAAEMTRLLSRLLRISIGRGRDTVLIQEELEHVECYLGIQRLRSASSAAVTYDIDPNVLYCRTPKVILQPIVENALVHAFSERDDGGAINISCKISGSKLVFQIKDNGKGFEHEFSGSIASIQEKENKEQFFIGVGLTNVAERIRLICGEEYGLSICSMPGKGTKVVISLPVMKGEDQYV